MKPQKKIKYIVPWSSFKPRHNPFTDILSEHFDLEFSDDPDFVIAVSTADIALPIYSYMDYDCVRILFSTEPVVCDFNIFDYGIGYDDISFKSGALGDRYYRFPYFYYCYYERMGTWFDPADHVMEGLSYERAVAALEQKKRFCNHIYGHESAYYEREAILDALEAYKRVDCAGSHRNNMPGGKTVPLEKEKLDFIKECKFTIAAESLSYPGFVTEKLLHAYMGYSIPIVFGDPETAREFNTKSMVNSYDFDTVEDLVDRVIEIDSNDELFIQRLMEPKFNSPDHLEKMHSGLEDFLVSIFSQEPDQAYRRMRHYIQGTREARIKEYKKLHEWMFYNAFSRDWALKTIAGDVKRAVQKKTRAIKGKTARKPKR